MLVCPVCRSSVLCRSVAACRCGRLFLVADGPLGPYFVFASGRYGGPEEVHSRSDGSLFSWLGPCRKYLSVEGEDAASAYRSVLEEAGLSSLAEEVLRS